MMSNKFVISVYNNRTGEETKWLEGYGNEQGAVRRAMEFSGLINYWERFDYYYTAKELKRQGETTIENYWTKVTIEAV